MYSMTSKIEQPSSELQLENSDDNIHTESFDNERLFESLSKLDMENPIHDDIESNSTKEITHVNISNNKNISNPSSNNYSLCMWS